MHTRTHVQHILVRAQCWDRMPTSMTALKLHFRSNSFKAILAALKQVRQLENHLEIIKIGRWFQGGPKHILGWGSSFIPGGLWVHMVIIHVYSKLAYIQVGKEKRQPQNKPSTYLYTIHTCISYIMPSTTCMMQPIRKQNRKTASLQAKLLIHFTRPAATQNIGLAKADRLYAYNLWVKFSPHPLSHLPYAS